jgi:PASTA domain
VLGHGQWWFHLRTGDNAGNWSTPVHLGQFKIDTTAPANPSLSSPSHTVGAWSNDSTVELAWSGATDAHSGIDGYSYEWSQTTSTAPDETKDSAASGTTSPVLADGSWWFHVRTVDAAGNWSAPIHLGPFRIDTTASTNPTLATTHPSAWSTDGTVEVTWNGASDEGSGVDGFSYAWSQSATTAPDTVKDAEETATGTTSQPLADGEWWFHLRTRDKAGNWSAPAHLGPFGIDTTAPANPTLSSPSHDVDAWSNDPTVELAWSGATDAHSGIDGYSYEWSQEALTPPDAVKDAEETATSTTSATLADGDWWYHLRTRDNAGNWSGAVHIGPFRIDTVAPTNPTLSSPSHTIGEWSNDETVVIAWAAIPETDGYSHQWSQNAQTTPDMVQDVEETTTAITSVRPDGSWWFHLRRLDQAGAWSRPSHIGPFHVDTTSPETAIVSGPPAFEFTASEPGVFRCALDGPPYADCAPPVLYEHLPPGEHVFRVYALDRAGNADATPAEHRWTISAAPSPSPPPPPPPTPAPPPPPPPQPQPAPAPPKTARAARCVVPRLTGRTLQRSRVLIARAGCRLGHVTRVYSARIKHGRIVKQQPRAGLRLKRGTRINVTVSLGRR